MELNNWSIRRFHWIEREQNKLVLFIIFIQVASIPRSSFNNPSCWVREREASRILLFSLISKLLFFCVCLCLLAFLSGHSLFICCAGGAAVMKNSPKEIMKRRERERLRVHHSRVSWGVNLCSVWFFIRQESSAVRGVVLSLQLCGWHNVHLKCSSSSSKPPASVHIFAWNPRARFFNLFLGCVHLRGYENIFQLTHFKFVFVGTAEWKTH